MFASAQIAQAAGGGLEGGTGFFIWVQGFLLKKQGRNFQKENFPLLNLANRVIIKQTMLAVLYILPEKQCWK